MVLGQVIATKFAEVGGYVSTSGCRSDGYWLERPNSNWVDMRLSVEHLSPVSSMTCGARRRKSLASVSVGV
jgi:hypothetical protein